LRKKNKRVLDLHTYWAEYHDHPDFGKNGLDAFDVIVSSEPTYVGIGKAIRDEIIAKNGREYSALFTAHAYSMDRMILYRRVLIPALKAGKTIVQSRSVSTSIVYQPIQSKIGKEPVMSVDDILKLEGNAFVMDYPPDLLIIPTIKNVAEVMKRLEGRQKDDNCQFENMDFQINIKPFYEGKELKKIFESRGCVVKYIDAGISIAETKNQSLNAYRTVIEK
jgi:thymidylate kinase